MTGSSFSWELSRTPTPLPPPPRRVRGTPGGLSQLWFPRIFILPHTAVGIGATCWWIFGLLWVMFAANIPGYVTGTDIHTSRKGFKSYIAKYEYRVGDEVKTGSGKVSKALYESFQNRDDPRPTVTVRYLRLGPFKHAGLSGSDTPFGGFAFFTLWVGFWDSIMSVFLYQLWIKPLRLRQLYKHGEACEGTLVKKRVQTGKSSSYYVSYTFKHPLTGELIATESQVWNVDAWKAAKEGALVTILYAPNNPRRSAVYELGGYRVDSTTDS